MDFLASSDSSSSATEPELAFLPENVSKEIGNPKYVAVATNRTREEGWMIFKIGNWDHYTETSKGPRVIISGLDDELQKRYNGTVLLQAVMPAPLHAVVLKVSEEDYDSLAEDRKTFQKLQTDGIVCRAGKTIITPRGNQLKITLCEPVQQGILGEETEIIPVTDNDCMDTIINGVGTPFSLTSQNDTNSDLDISQFLSLPSSEDDMTEATFTEEVGLLASDEHLDSHIIPLQVRVLERPIEKFALDPHPSESEDDAFRVYANLRDIARIGVFSGNWVIT